MHTHTNTQALIRCELHVRISVVSSLEAFTLRPNTRIRKYTHIYAHTQRPICGKVICFAFYLLITYHLSSPKQNLKGQITHPCASQPPVHTAAFMSKQTVQPRTSPALFLGEMILTNMVIRQRKNRFMALLPFKHTEGVFP